MVNVFAREITGPLTSLVKQLDQQAEKNDGLRGFVVVLTDDADATAEKLEALAKKEGIKNLPLTVFENTAGPPSYKIAPDAEVTVMMWVGTEVKVNHAFAKGELDNKAVKKVVADVPKILN